jgi:predicted RNA binding protein YcfA (HicA-like mRNA interferase family)
LRDILELAGFRQVRMEGDHLIMERPGTARPAVFPMVNDLGEDIIQSNKRTAELTSTEFRRLAEEVCGKRRKKKR